MNTFTRVEKVLAYHHTTTKSPMVLKDLIRKAEISLKEARELLASWPSGYKVTKFGQKEYIEASETPLNLSERNKRFKNEFKRAEVTDQPSVCVPKVMSSTNKITKPTSKPKVRMSMDEILQRVMAKSAEAASVAQRSEKVRHDFIVAQIPIVEGVLRSLTALSQTLSLNEVIRKVQASARSPLGANEVEQVLDKIDFVKVFNAGGVKCVELCKSKVETIARLEVKA